MPVPQTLRTDPSYDGSDGYGTVSSPSVATKDATAIKFPRDTIKDMESGLCTGVYFSFFSLPGGNYVLTQRFIAGNKRRSGLNRIVIHSLVLSVDILAHYGWDVAYIAEQCRFTLPQPEGQQPIIGTLAVLRQPLGQYNIKFLPDLTIGAGELTQQEALFSKLNGLFAMPGFTPAATRDLFSRTIYTLQQNKPVLLPQEQRYQQFLLLAWSMLPPTDRQNLSWTTHSESNTTFKLANGNFPTLINIPPEYETNHPEISLLANICIPDAPEQLDKDAYRQKLGDLYARLIQHNISIREPERLRSYLNFIDNPNVTKKSDIDSVIEDLKNTLQWLIRSGLLMANTPWIDRNKVSQAMCNNWSKLLDNQQGYSTKKIITELRSILTDKKLEYWFNIDIANQDLRCCLIISAIILAGSQPYTDQQISLLKTCFLCLYVSEDPQNREHCNAKNKQLWDFVKLRLFFMELNSTDPAIENIISNTVAKQPDLLVKLVEYNMNMQPIDQQRMHHLRVLADKHSNDAAKALLNSKYLDALIKDYQSQVKRNVKVLPTLIKKICNMYEIGADNAQTSTSTPNLQQWISELNNIHTLHGNISDDGQTIIKALISDSATTGKENLRTELFNICFTVGYAPIECSILIKPPFLPVIMTALLTGSYNCFIDPYTNKLKPILPDGYPALMAMIRYVVDNPKENSTIKGQLEQICYDNNITWGLCLLAKNNPLGLKLPPKPELPVGVTIWQMVVDFVKQLYSVILRN